MTDTTQPNDDLMMGGYVLPEAAEAPPDAPKRRRSPRAKARQEEVRENDPRAADGPRLFRRRRKTEDRFWIDPKVIPAGVDYNWKRASTRGLPDTEHINNLRENHWAPVPASRHAGVITEKDGMILMERPLYLSQEAQREDLGIALDQVQSVSNAIVDTPNGTMTRNHPSVRARTVHNRSYNLTIPSDGESGEERR